jgi:hypothetical protein
VVPVDENQIDDDSDATYRIANSDLTVSTLAEAKPEHPWLVWPR